jgi:GntR family transcriptional regulator, arabinose operon transcriptional repressor
MKIKSDELEPSASASGTAARPRKYQRILDHLYAEIFSGRVAPGDALPTEAELSENLGISRGTIRHALDKLVQDGVIYRVQGRGTFVSTEQRRQARQQLDVFALIAPQLREGLYPSLVQGFERSSGAMYHQVLIGNSDNDASRQGDLILQMIDRSIGGVALVPITSAATPAYQIRQLHKNQIPIVFCHRAIEDVSAPCVTWSGHEVGRQAGIALADQGHRHVAFLFDYRTPMSESYEKGLRAALADYDLLEGKVTTAEYGPRQPGTSTSKQIQQALDKVFAAANRPTAVFCGNVTDAEQVYLHAEARGLKVPRDLSLVAFGGTWRAHGLAERISCVAVDEVALGVRAAEVLHEMREGKRALDSDERIEFGVTLFQGETIGPPKNLQPQGAESN